MVTKRRTLTMEETMPLQLAYHVYRENSGHRMPPVRLQEAAYALAIQAFVIVTVDIAIYDPAVRTFWLAKRIVEPFPDWWILGGRLYAGEEERVGAVRTLARETTYHVKPARLKLIGLNRYYHSTRQQPPQDTGSDCLAYTFAIELTTPERTLVAKGLNRTEYDPSLGLREFNRAALERLTVLPSTSGRALLDLYNSVFP